MFALTPSQRAALRAAALAAILIATGLVSTSYAAGEPPPPEAASSESYLLWVIRCSGVIGAVILLLSLYFVATVTRLFMEMRQVVAAPPELLEQAEALIQVRDFRSLYQVAKQSDSFLGQVVAVGMSELPQGLGEAREAMDRSSDALTINMEKQISMLAVLGTLGPMIGLLGTLKGMIASFSVIALSDVQLKSSEVAGGISEALLLTFEGVALSVPAIYFFAIFRNRVATISATTTFEAEQLVRRMYHAMKPKTPPSPMAPAAVTK